MVMDAVLRIDQLFLAEDALIARCATCGFYILMADHRAKACPKCEPVLMVSDGSIGYVRPARKKMWSSFSRPVRATALTRVQSFG